MAQSKCISCNATSGFEMKTDIGVGGTDKQYGAIQCKSCGGVVSIVEGWHISSALWKIMQKLGINDPHG